MNRLLYGDFGSGKTHTLLESIAEDAKLGRRVFWIVPEQQAVTSERMMLDLLPPSYQLSVEILSFSRLYNRVCRECGGLHYHYITKPLKTLMMWKTLRDLAPMLEEYGNKLTSDPAFPSLMLSTVGELKASSLTPSMLERAARMTDDELLARKLRDLALIHASFDGLVSMSFEDSADDLTRLSTILEKHPFFRSSKVYIDGFTSFTAPELAVIRHMFAQSDHTTVTLPLPFPHSNLLYSGGINRSEIALLRAAEENGGVEVVCLTENHRAENEPLRYLSKNIWDLSAKPYESEPAGEITLELCRTPYEEAQAAARHVRAAMQSGIRCRDILVVARDAEQYRGIIDPALEQNDVPYYFSTKSDLCSKPLIKFILSALRIHIYSWQPADVISHLKTGIYDLPSRSIDLFESYVNTWHIRGNRFTEGEWIMNPDGYTADMTPRAEEILRTANEVRETLVSSLDPLFRALKNAENAEQMCRAIYEFLTERSAEDHLRILAQREAECGNLREAEETASLYRITLEALASVGQSLGEESLDLREFSEALKLIFEETEVGTIPTSADEVVIGSASMIRANNPKCVIVLGLCEGQFPATPKEKRLLSSVERTRLSDIGLSFQSDLNTDTQDEYLYVKKVFSLPTTRLVLLRSSMGVDKQTKHPSLAWNRVLRLFPTLKPHCFVPEDLSYLPPAPRGVIATLGAIKDKDLNASLRNLLRTLPDLTDSVSQNPLPLSEPVCHLEAETANLLFGEKMNLTQSRLDKYVRCHFSYYCTYVLSLRGDRRAALREAEIGTFVHYILEHLLGLLVTEEGVRTSVGEVELCRMTESAVREYVAMICPPAEQNAGRIRHLSARLSSLSLLLLRNIMEEFSHSEFRPYAFELPMDGKNGHPAPLEFVLRDGGRVSLHGIIDRVDLYRKDGEIYVRVVDYKTGSKDFSLEDIQYGLNVQMLLYLFALCQKNDGGERKPAGVVYLSSNFPQVDLDDFGDTASETAEASDRLSRQGLLLRDEEILRSMNDELSSDFLPGVKVKKDGTIQGNSLLSEEEFHALRREIEAVVVHIASEMKRGSAHASPLKYGGSSPCEYCEMKPICRNVQR